MIRCIRSGRGRYCSGQLHWELAKATKWLYYDCGIVLNEKKNEEDFSWSNF